MASLQEICKKQGIDVEKLLDFALKNLEASRQEISLLEEERTILERKVNLHQTLWDSQQQHFQQRLTMNEMMHKERELTHAYEIAKSNLLHGARQKDALLLKLRLDYALDDLEELEMRYEFLMVELKEEQAKAQALNKCLHKKDKEPKLDKSLILLEVEQRTRSLQETVRKMETDHHTEIAKVKAEHKRISSLRKHEVSALLRERDFVWDQLKRMEKDYADRLKSKNEQLQVASENIEKLRLKMEELQQENDEKNVALTILKVELGEKESETQILKENNHKTSDSTGSLEDIRDTVQIFKQRNEKERKLQLMEDACSVETCRESPQVTKNQTFCQDIVTTTGIFCKQDQGYFENTNIRNNEEIKLHSTVDLNAKENQEMSLDALQLETDNTHLNDKKVPVKNSATPRNHIYHGLKLNNELDKVDVCLNLVSEPLPNEPLFENNSHDDNNKEIEGMQVIRYPLERHGKPALEF